MGAPLWSLQDMQEVHAVDVDLESGIATVQASILTLSSPALGCGPDICPL